MEILADFFGVILGVVLSLAMMALILCAPFWLAKVGWRRYKAYGLHGIFPWVAQSSGGLKLSPVARIRSSFDVECDNRYERARHAVRDIFRQDDPGPRVALMFEPDNWRSFLVKQWSVSGFDTPFVFLSPIAVQAMDLSRRRCTCGLLDGVDEESGGSWESPERDMLPGSRFRFRSLSVGAKCNAPGIRIALQASCKGDIGTPQTREETPFLCVRFHLFDRTDTIAAPPVDGKPEWRFDETFFNDAGVMDFAGEIPYTAQIALISGDIGDYSNVTPLSDIAVGTVNIASARIPL